MGLEKQVAKIGRLEELTTEAKESLVGAINEVAAGGGGGGGGGALVVHIVDNYGSYTKDHTYAEIVAAFPNVVIYEEGPRGKYQFIPGITSDGDVVATRVYVGEASSGYMNDIYEDKYTISSDESIAFESAERSFGG